LGSINSSEDSPSSLTSPLPSPCPSLNVGISQKSCGFPSLKVLCELGHSSAGVSSQESQTDYYFTCFGCAQSALHKRDSKLLTPLLPTSSLCSPIATIRPYVWEREKP
jgi:hypothetical protein